MQSIKNIKIFSGNANRELAESIANYLELPMGRAQVKRFSDGEVWVEIDEKVRGAEVFVIQPTPHPPMDTWWNW